MQLHEPRAAENDSRAVLAIDLGGTKATVALIRADGRVLARSVAPTPRGSAEAAIHGFAARADELVAHRLPAERPVAVGLALPAIVDERGMISWAAAGVSTWLGAPALESLEHQFRLPARVQFDGYGQRWEKRSSARDVASRGWPR